ncbi:hypothetical protein [Campylobacter taeniopygiae]|uniref:DUF4149 domain-containing protein n=1 Tax=Campylobacter taeniopygiae TaxID=2510188 RepID=A0ABY2THU7_9BACT|nr:hypothetical protein [Campylobacter taeniopygiae]TKX33592.1 hypothetical protein CQA75_06875 [Campylobacter taeniopygiae]
MTTLGDYIFSCLWTAFIVCVSFPQEILKGLAPFIIALFFPKIRQILSKEKSIIYWFFYGIICCVSTGIIFSIAISYDNIHLKAELDFIFFATLIFNICSLIYLLIFKIFILKKHKIPLVKKEKYYLLGLNLLFFLLFYIICKLIAVFKYL